MSVASSSHPDPPREQPSPQEPNGPGATILGCAGESLTAAERRFFADADPLGFILFRRNCTAPEQVSALVADLRDAVGRPDAPVLLHLAGGRVARLQPPFWRSLPPAGGAGPLDAAAPHAGPEPGPLLRSGNRRGG